MTGHDPTLNDDEPFSHSTVVVSFMELESTLERFLNHVPLVAEHASVWSPTLGTCILEACSQLDSFWKSIASSGSKRTMRQHFESFASIVAGQWLIVWGHEPTVLVPFKSWQSPEGVASDYRETPWWHAYNALKHDRWANIREATLANATNAVAGLFLGISLSKVCLDELVAKGWFHSCFALGYAIDQIQNNELLPELGATVESRLFSFALASNHPDFERSLVCYRNCTHRLGRWLENKYKRGVLMY